MTYTKIYLLRHGEYENKNKILPLRMRGFPLSKEGEKQILKVIQYLKNKKIACIYSSPILRCRQTAQLIAKKIQKGVYYSQSLLELKSPIQGISLKKYDKLALKYPNFPYDYPLHIKKGGETISEVYQRMSKFIFKLVVKYSSKNILVVSHGDPLMILIYGLVFKNIDSFLKKELGKYIPKAGLALLKFKGKNFLKFSSLNW